MTENAPRIMPPIWFILTLAVQRGLAEWAPVGEVVPVAVRPAGFALIGVALVGFFWSAGLFSRHGTSIRPGAESDVLIRTGLYRYSRNPIYLSMVLMQAGFALEMGALSPFLPIVPFLWWIQRRFIRLEESMLHERFGEEYERYCGEVRRWI